MLNGDFKKEKVIHSCGHTVMVEVYINTKRLSTKAWIETKKCYRCRFQEWKEKEKQK